MTITREGTDIRVERSEHKARTNGWFSFLFPAAGAVYMAAYADSAGEWLLTIPFLALGLFLLRHNLTRRDFCLITPDKVEHGIIGGRSWSIDRGPLASVYVADNFLLQVRFFDAAGKTRESFVLANFDSAELREAFEEAGFRMR